MPFVADDFGAWLVGVLADAGLRKLTGLVLGTDQERALRSAASAAVRRATAEVCPDDEKRAGHVALVVGQVFGMSVPGVLLAGGGTMLEALEAEIAGQLAVLDDVGLTGQGLHRALGRPRVAQDAPWLNI